MQVNIIAGTGKRRIAVLRDALEVLAQATP